MKIIPSLIAKNKKELDIRFEKVKNISNLFQIDVMDGKFVKNSSFQFNFKLPKNKKYEAHLMVKNPTNWIKKNSKKVDTIIIHYESEDKTLNTITLIKKKKKKVGLAINPKTKIKKILEYLPMIDILLIMTVNPGKYGGKFLPNALKKVRELRKLKPKLNIEVDGGINNKTIKQARKAGANSFVIGSYLQENNKIRELKNI